MIRSTCLEMRNYKESEENKHLLGVQKGITHLQKNVCDERTEHPTQPDRPGLMTGHP